MNALTLLTFFSGLALLVIGGELLVRGASRFAVAVGISPLVVGLTVVAFGTSAPELAVSVAASIAGQGDLAVGNIVGSNISNTLFILGLSALVAPLVVSQQLIRIDVPIMIGVSIAMLVMARDNLVSTAEGVVLFAGVIAYTTFAILKSRSESRSVRSEYERQFGAGSGSVDRKKMAMEIGLVLAGIVLLNIGAKLLVSSAVEFARFFGVSELVIGLTVVAMGTSLPELSTSVIAAFRGERDIAVGNVVGSNIFNILCVLGATATVIPVGIRVAPAALSFDIPVMIAVSIATLPIFFSGYRIMRWEGGLFLFYYVVYLVYVVMNAADHDALPIFSTVMLEFFIPITVITLLVSGARALRKQGLPE